MAANGTSRTTGWNGIQLNIPVKWETIISDHCHLLFEQDLEPILELKWQRGFGGKKKLDTVINNLQNEFGDRNCTVDKKRWSARFPGLQTVFCSWAGEEQVSILLLSCPECETIFLCRFLQPAPDKEQLFEILQTLQCHNQQDDTLWSALDFSFAVPKELQLKTFSVAAGFTRLTFEHGKRQLHLCRLAPASQRLKDTKLEDILAKLVGAEDTIQKTDHQYTELYTTPSILIQIRRRLKRVKPFKYGRLWHDQETDRLVGFCLEDISPIPSTLVQHLYDNHEIFS